MKAIDYYHCKECKKIMFTRYDNRKNHKMIWASAFGDCRNPAKHYTNEREATHKEKLFFSNNEI